ncbi:MAG TPA: GntR family transcriptional regulator [Planctomycetota bacterium]|nr:GntR family transcriptional regulator [Planctomycetota bacterium]
MGLLLADEVKRRIHQHILEGRLAPNQLLPTINEMAVEFNVSSKTVQKAVNALREEGIIASKRGVGLFIRPLELKRSRGRRIGLIHPNSPEYLKGKVYPAPIVERMAKDLEREGLTLVPFCITDRMALIEAVAKASFSALALFEIDNEALIFDFQRLRLPMVSVDYDACRHGISSVVFDNAYGMFQATKHLLEQGHRRIAFLRPLLRNSLNNNQSLDAVEDIRRIGYCIAMQDAGLPVDIVELEVNDEALRSTTVDLLYRNPRTAAVCPSDHMAMLLSRNVTTLNAKIPDEISIIGFGDFAVEFAPGRVLASVKIDFPLMGAAAARLVTHALQQHDGWNAKREVIPVSLALHDSVGPPKRV